MDPDSTLPRLTLLFALLGANAFFVTTEFALLTLRRSWLEHSARNGDRRAARIVATLDRVEELSLVAQLGRGVSTLLIGYLATRLALDSLAPGPLTEAGAVALALAVVAVIHLIFGEQIPKLLGIQRATWVATRLVRGPLRWVSIPLRPLIWLLCLVVAALARASRLSFPGSYPLAHTPEEIQRLVAHGHEQGVVEEDEREMIDSVFEFSDTVAREVMTPRIDIVAVSTDISLPELVRVLIEEGHSRVPVYEGTIDSVVGVLLAKDLLGLLADGGRRSASFDVRRVMREPYFVPDTKPVDDILAEFRQRNVHLAIVLDEFGGTYGLVTMEDVLEEIVGEINDEYDEEEPDFAPTPEGDVLIDGGAAISEVNERFGLALPDQDFDTIGGYIFGALGRVPVPGDEVAGLGTDQEAVLLVEETEERRVLRVRLTRGAASDLPVE